MVVLQWLRQVEEVECHRFETSLGYVLSKKKKKQQFCRFVGACMCNHSTGEIQPGDQEVKGYSERFLSLGSRPQPSSTSAL